MLYAGSGAAVNKCNHTHAGTYGRAFKVCEQILTSLSLVLPPHSSTSSAQCLLSIKKGERDETETDLK